MHDIVENTNRHPSMNSTYEYVPLPVDRVLTQLLNPGAPLPPPPCRVTVTDPPPAKKPKGMPRDYYFAMPDVGSNSPPVIQPGKSILFSVPVDHISWDWHMEIPFRFELPLRDHPGEPLVGGYVDMTVRYSEMDLPEAVWKQIDSARQQK
jgi:hypothetical protein